MKKRYFLCVLFVVIFSFTINVKALTREEVVNAINNYYDETDDVDEVSDTTSSDIDELLESVTKKPKAEKTQKPKKEKKKKENKKVAEEPVEETVTHKEEFIHQLRLY